VRRRLSPTAWVVSAALAALIALLAYGVVSGQPDHGIDAALASGHRAAAPSLTLPRLGGGGSESLADRRGEVVILNYWASWCDPCRDESPLLERWHKRIVSRDGTVLGVDTLDLTSDAQSFVRRYQLTYPMLRDGDGGTQSRFGVVGYPETIVLDRRGRIAAVQRGPVDDEFLTRTVLPLLAERG
jgi:cytochrome c biogenesis protein CcmG, thiol:disulfide interchange protein DsbE